MKYRGAVPASLSIRMIPPRTLIPLALLCACGCSDTPSVGAADPTFVFVDVAREAGIDVELRSGDPRRWYIPESNGSGAAWLDYDSDGDMDLFCGNGQSLVYEDDGARLALDVVATSRLYRNDGALKFTDVTEATGTGLEAWVNAVAAGDVDNDGDPDLYLACFGRDVFLRNDGGVFVDATADAGLGSEWWGAGAAFGDLDRDGNLDLYVANYVDFDLEAPPDGGKRNVIEGVEIGWGPVGENGRGYNVGAPDVYYRGDGTGHFVEATAQAGFALEKALCSYAVVFSDVDGDQWPDVLVSNDVEPCNLFHNRGDGTFEEQGLQRGFATGGDGHPTSAMGLALCDFDYDGDFDVLRTNFDFEANCFHVNQRGQFTDRARQLGLAETTLDKLGWAAGFADLDLDLDLDLVIANGHVLPQAEEIGMSGWQMSSQLFEAVTEPGEGVRYVDVTESVVGNLADLSSARGIALGDPDDDGDVDLLVTGIDEVPRLLENRSRRKGHWLAVRTIGTRSNRDGLGARVTVELVSGTRLVREVRRTEGLYSSHDPRLHFGLGNHGVRSIEVLWPSGELQTIEAPELDRLHVITEPATEDAR